MSDSERMKEFKPHRPKGGWYSYPSPEDCILEMINSQLQVIFPPNFKTNTSMCNSNSTI